MLTLSSAEEKTNTATKYRIKMCASVLRENTPIEYHNKISQTRIEFRERFVHSDVFHLNTKCFLIRRQVKQGMEHDEKY